MAKAQRKFWYVGVGLLLSMALLVQWRSASNVPLTDFRVLPLRQHIEGASLCPWRQPGTDLHTFFPTATRYNTQSPILSSLLVEIKERLGRWLTPDENPLYLHRVYQQQQPLGTILVRRVKGEYGAIEIVLAVDEQGKVCGLKLQRLREPEPIAQALRSPQWLRAFEGQTAASQWRLGQAVSEVPAAAQPSARAIVEGVRSSLILLDVILYNKV